MTSLLRSVNNKYFRASPVVSQNKLDAILVFDRLVTVVGNHLKGSSVHLENRSMKKRKTWIVWIAASATKIPSLLDTGAFDDHTLSWIGFDEDACGELSVPAKGRALFEKDLDRLRHDRICFVVFLSFGMT